MRNSTRVFIVLSIVILFLEVCFVAFNYQNQERAFHRNLQEKAA